MKISHKNCTHKYLIKIQTSTELTSWYKWIKIYLNILKLD